jgi:hypothetical protein
VLCLDRRDGRIVFERDDIPIQQTNSYEFIGNRAASEVTLSLASTRSSQRQKTFTFTLTEDPKPPEPSAQTGAASSRIVERPPGGFRGLGRIIGEGLRPEPPPDYEFPEDDFDPRFLPPRP